MTACQIPAKLVADRARQALAGVRESSVGYDPVADRRCAVHAFLLSQISTSGGFPKQFNTRGSACPEVAPTRVQGDA